MDKESTTEVSQVDEDFVRWMRHFQERDFFTNNMIVLAGFGGVGALLPITVNSIQLRPLYTRPWLVPIGFFLGLRFGHYCNTKAASFSVQLNNDIDFYSDRKISKADRWEQRKPSPF